MASTALNWEEGGNHTFTPSGSSPFLALLMKLNIVMQEKKNIDNSDPIDEYFNLSVFLINIHGEIKIANIPLIKGLERKKLFELLNMIYINF